MIKILRMIKVEHTVFAFPFAFVGALMAIHAIPPLRIIFFIVVAMISARSAAMTLNRIIDRRFDALNIRTKNREIPAGKVKVRNAWIFTIASLIVFEFSAFCLNNLCFMLSPIALFFILTYSYSKRFTPLCHLYLGATDAIAPLGGYIAAKGAFGLDAIFLSLGVMFWIAGFDILYSLQDVEFDKKAGLYSLPVSLGEDKALIIARLFHLFTVVLFFLAFYYCGLHIFSYIAVVISAFLLIYEHLLARPRELDKINIAFFNINGYISIILFVFVFMDILIL
ncbi:MAG: 4-hydroxybenzoate octaprenyltransferase [Deltaproteobacteria bacterium]|nr:4-hydroxybenzoate octaprenyltransferase [Deltaproteobacteria bacterium]